MKKEILILLSIVVILFWQLWMPEPKIAGDLFFWYPESLKVLAQPPTLWREVLVSDGFGQYIVFSLWIWPVLFLFGLLSSIDYSILVRLIGIIPFILLSAFGIYNLLSYFKIKGWGRFIGTFFYLTNTYVLLLIDGGQIYLGLAYAVLPWTFLFYRQSLESGLLKKKLLFIITILAISVFDIRALYFAFLLIITSFIFDILFNSDKIKTNLISHLLLGLSTGISLLLIHLPWILPSILAKSPSLPVTYDRTQQVDFLSFASLGHSLLLLQPNWFLNTFGKVTTLKPEFYLIPFLVFLAPVLRIKSKKVFYWATVALIAVFLSKGSQEPFGFIYKWLFDNLPGFVLFRDSTKFYFLVSLAYSILFAFTIDSLVNLKFKIAWVNKIIKLTAPIVLLYLIFLARPIYLGQMTGLFSNPLYKEDYANLSKFLAGDKQYSRILYVPHHLPLGYSAPTHPAIDGLYLTGKRPFAIGAKGTYEAVNFLREAPFMGQVLDVAGISYIVFPPLDPRRDDMHPDNVNHYYKFIEQISSLPWVVPQKLPLNIPTIKVQQHQDKFFLASNLWWVVGSDSLYFESTKSANLKLSNNALVFIEEAAGLGQRLQEFPEAKIVLNNKSTNDLAATFIDPQKFIFPAKKLDFNPGINGWWKREAIDLMWWRDFLQTKYGIDNTDFDLGGGWAIAEKKLKLEINDPKIVSDSFLLARVMESSRGGQIKFYQGNSPIGQIDTSSPDRDSKGTNIKWFEIGKLLENNKLSIETEGDINIVNALAVLSNQEWEKYKKEASQLEKEKRVVNFSDENIDLSSAEVKYQEVDATNYKVNISGVSKPKFLVFSQSYDVLWKLNGSYPLPAYSLLNVYRIDSDGQYNMVFEPQRYVFPGFIISLLSMGGISVLLLLSCRRRK